MYSVDILQVIFFQMQKNKISIVINFINYFYIIPNDKTQFYANE